MQKNLDLLAASHPGLASVIAGARTVGLERCETRRGEVNLRRGPNYYHSNYSAVRELQQVLAKINLESIKVVYCFGVGCGHLFGLLRNWLDEDPGHYLVFIDDDLGVWQHLMDLPATEELVKHPQVVFSCLQGGEEEWELACQHLAYHFVQLPFAILALPYYERVKEAEYYQIQSFIRHKSAMINFAGAEFLTHGAAFFKNFYRNMLQLPGTCRSTHLYGRFAGIPAIICGAGPSLNKNIEVLKQMQDKALIFAGGSAVKALSTRGLQPHFGGSVDPNREQYERMNSHSAHEVPMLFKGRVYHRALNTFHGPRVYLPGNNGYPITDWMQDRLGIGDPSPHEGHNILHLMIDVAREFACNPIIFVGMDLAFTGMQCYASDVVGRTKVEAGEITTGDNLNANAFLRKDIYGEPIYTLWKWVAESNYTSKYCQSFPEIKFLNATEGGLGVPGVENVTLQSVDQSLPAIQEDLRGRLHGELEISRMRHFTSDGVKALWEELRDSLLECETQLDQMQQALDKVIVAIRQGDAKGIKGKSAEVESVQEALSKQVAYEKLLEPLNQVRSILFERQWSEIEVDSRFQTEGERLIRLFEAQKEEVDSLRTGAKINRIILEASLDEEGAYQEEFSSDAEGPLELVRDGDAISYKYANGQLAYECVWKDGKRCGDADYYYASGSKYATLPYASGKAEGVHRYYYESGKLKSEIPYEDGELHGQVRLYWPEGHLRKVVTYERGIRSGEDIEHDVKGNPLVSKHYRDNRVTEARYFSSDGELVEEHRFHWPKPYQDCRKWDEQGRLRFEEIYSEDRFRHREWDEGGELVRDFKGFWDGVRNQVEANLVVSDQRPKSKST